MDNEKAMSIINSIEPNGELLTNGQVIECMRIAQQVENTVALADVGGSFKITEPAQKKLDFILGHSIARDFPETNPTKEWAGAVLDLLEIIGLLK